MQTGTQTDIKDMIIHTPKYMHTPEQSYKYKREENRYIHLQSHIDTHSLLKKLTINRIRTNIHT